MSLQPPSPRVAQSVIPKNGTDDWSLGPTSERMEIPKKVNTAIDKVKASKTLYGSLKITNSRD